MHVHTVGSRDWVRQVCTCTSAAATPPTTGPEHVYLRVPGVVSHCRMAAAPERLPETVGRAITRGISEGLWMCGISIEDGRERRVLVASTLIDVLFGIL